MASNDRWAWSIGGMTIGMLKTKGLKTSQSHFVFFILFTKNPTQTLCCNKSVTNHVSYSMTVGVYLLDSHHTCTG